MSEAAAAKAQREALVDPLRPRYHFLPPGQWMNDPNGLVQWQGQYHLFYQHNPNRAAWGDIHWGHAVSDDLVHWRHRPPALSPEMEPTDPGGCWTGCAVKDGERLTLLYTGVENGVQHTCAAYANADLTHFEKHPGNPIATMPEGLPISHGAYRDPFVWRQGDWWYQVIGTSLEDQGQVLLYRSRDLLTWEYLHPLLEDEVRSRFPDAGQIWECPNFFPAGDKHVLLVGRWLPESLSGVLALVGDYRDDRFYPESLQPFDHADSCHYATQVFQDDQGRWLAFGWLQEQRPQPAQLEAGWSGVMSLPRVLSQQDGRLRQRFAPELEQLRGSPTRLENHLLTGPTSLGTFPNAVEIHARVRIDEATSFGLRLRHSEREETVVCLDGRACELVIDRARSSLAEADRTPIVAPLSGGEVDLHLYLDGSVIELIANEQEAASGRLYPSQAERVEVELVAEGGSAMVAALDCWPLASIWSPAAD